MTREDKRIYEYDVFVSYSHADSAWVQEELMPRLVAWRLSVAIDVETFVPGDHLLASVDRAIRSSRHVVFVVTRAFAASEWTRREIRETIARDPAILARSAIPIVLEEDAVPPELRNIFWCRRNPGSGVLAWNSLAKALGVDPATQAEAGALGDQHEKRSRQNTPPFADSSVGPLVHRDLALLDHVAATLALDHRYIGSVARTPIGSSGIQRGTLREVRVGVSTFPLDPTAVFKFGAASPRRESLQLTTRGREYLRHSIKTELETLRRYSPHYVVFPELVFPATTLAEAETTCDQLFGSLSDNPTVVAGSFHDPDAVNTAVIVGSGQVTFHSQVNPALRARFPLPERFVSRGPVAYLSANADFGILLGFDLLDARLTLSYARYNIAGHLRGELSNPRPLLFIAVLATGMTNIARFLQRCAVLSLLTAGAVVVSHAGRDSSLQRCYCLGREVAPLGQEFGSALFSIDADALAVERAAFYQSMPQDVKVILGGAA